MKQKKSHDVELSDQEFQLIEALKENPEMLDQFTSITQKFNQEVESGMDAHEAERHVIKSIQEVGRSMISNGLRKPKLKQSKKLAGLKKSSGTVKKTLLVLHPRTNLLRDSSRPR